MRRIISDDRPLSDESVPTLKAAPKRIDGVVIGALKSFDGDGVPYITHPEYDGELSARSTVALTAADQGREVALMFEGGDSRKPIVLGLVHQPAPVEVTVDNKRLVLDAQEEIVLRCGKSSITLTKAGKILIRGEYLLSRSSGVNRIKGGSVQIN